MFKKRKVFAVFIIFLILFLTVTVVLMILLSKSESKVRKKSSSMKYKILQEVEELPVLFKQKRAINDTPINLFIRNLNYTSILNNTIELPSLLNTWVSKTKLYEPSSFHLGKIITALRNEKIIKADVDSRGTQLKLHLILENKLEVVYKPKWYDKEVIISGVVYSGKDRFEAEILAFYLSGILQLPLVPISTQRKISLQKDIVPVATERLLTTMFVQNGTSSYCVFGKCFYCTRKEPVCEENGVITGAAIVNINSKFKMYKSPWQRTYKEGKEATWQKDDNYCQFVQEKLPEKRILDLIDVAIFDFLIQNGDRHRYETLNNKVFLIDNGKGLRNPFYDELDILAPLYQCCKIKNSTWNTLESLSGGRLKEYLLRMPDIHDIVSDKHLDAINRRLLFVYAAVQYCRKSNKIEFR